MSEHPPQTIQVALCFAQVPRLDPAAILGAIRQQRPDADLVDGERNGAVLVRYRRLSEQYPGARTAPLLNAITTPVEDLDQRDLTHSGGWKQAAEVLRRCRYSLLVTEFLGRDVATATRLSAYQAALAAVIEATRPLATWWPVSRQALPPDQAAQDPLRGLVNVRTFTEPPFADPRDEDVALMDTLGLGQLGLPDLQCHFRYLDRDLMTDLMTNATRFLAGGGRFTGAMRGLTAHQQWPVRPARALAGPGRAVLTVDPGSPFLVEPTR